MMQIKAFGKTFGKPSAPKAKRERKAREPITTERLIAALLAFARNALLVLSVLGIAVLAAAVYLLFKQVGGAATDQVTQNLCVAAAALTLGGGYVTLWLGRRWDIIPF